MGKTNNHRFLSSYASKAMLLLLLVFIGSSYKVVGQIPDSLWIKTSSVRFWQNIHPKSSFAESAPGRLTEEQILNLSFSKTKFKKFSSGCSGTNHGREFDTQVLYLKRPGGEKGCLFHSRLLL
ncbi:MAG: hypothetical protein IPP79_15895 [Chitinophagaceae bacterium]|nr:hypothetical protein [Chitinophagaceae bacterium]